MKRVKDMNAINRIVQLKLNRSLTQTDSHSPKKSIGGSNLETINDMNKHQDSSNFIYTKERENSANDLNSSSISKSNLERFESRLKAKA